MKTTSNLLLLLTLTIFSCKQQEPDKKAMPVQTYKVTEIQKANTTLITEYPATLEGISDIEIRAKIDGYIEKIYVDEGQEVKKGQMLFKLETQMASQDAAALKAKVDLAQVEVNRLMPLVQRNIISEVQLQSAKANLASAKSAYQSSMARINYATIKSPIDGIVGTLPLRVGSYVSSQTAQPLTTISDISSVYAYFSVNEKEQLDIMMKANGKSFQDKIASMPEVQLILSNEAEYKTKGRIETFSGQANTQTGSFNVRARFTNEDRLLRSGGSGTIQIPTFLKEVLLIPQSATSELQNKRIAVTIDNQNKTKFAVIEVRPVSGGKFFVVSKGLNVGDKILLEGVGIISEGTEVKPEIINYNQIVNPEK